MRLGLKLIQFLLFYALAAGMLLTLTRIAQARSIHIETGLGMSTISNTDPFFGVGGPTAATPGFGGDIGLYAGIFGNVIEFQLGLENKFSSGSGSTGNYMLDVPYGVFRVQISKIFFGVGYSTFVYRQSNNLPEAMTLTQTEGASAMIMEGGILFPVTPLFSMGGKGSIETITGGGGTSPSVMTISFLLRFYFEISGSQATSNEYKGWRYPFGREIF